MLCSEFDARVQDLLDQRKSPERDPFLICHAQQCADCHLQMETLTRLLDSLDLVEIPDLPADFSGRVVDSVVNSQSVAASRQSPSNWTLVLVALAATLLLAAIPIVWNTSQGGSEVALPSLGPPSPTPTRSSGSLKFLPDDQGWLVSSAFLNLYPEAARERHRQQVNRTLGDLRPIATPFNAAMTAIRRTIPVGRSHTKGEPRAAVDRSNGPAIDV